MLKISEFANMVGVSEQALKFYERKGLFCPARINKETGYRYYSPAQLKEFERISEMKLLGLSIEEIKAMKNGNYSVDEQIAKLYAKREAVNRLIDALETYKASNAEYSVGIKTEKPFYYLEKTVVAKDIPDLERMIIDFNREIAEIKIKFACPTYIFSEFTDNKFVLENIHAKIRVAVKNDGILAKLRDKTTYIYTLHSGDYEKIGRAYDFLFEYAMYSGFKVTGNPEERYIVNVGNGGAEEYLTEVRLPVEEGKKTVNIKK